jgi:type I restriction enzyme S subunit
MSDENDIAIPTGWFKARASEVCEKIQDGTHFSPKAQLAAGQYPYVTAKNVRPSGLDLRDITYLSEQDHREIYARCDCRRGDVLLVKDGVNTGDAAINIFDGEISLLSSVCMLRPKTEVLDAGFLRYYLQSPQCTPFLLGGMTGTAIRRIILKRIKALPVLACAIPQQRRIVAAIESHFSRLDAATATLERVQRNLERYRASVLKAAVEGRLVPTEAELAKKEGRSYEPASVLLKRILAQRRRRWEEAELAKLRAKGKPPTDDRWKSRYEEPASPDVDGLSELPEGWCWTTLEAIAEVKGGLAKGKHRRSGEKLAAVPYLRVANVQRGHLDLSEVKSIEATESELADLALRSGDILFNEGGDRDKLGRGWIWRAELPVCIHQNHVFRARLLSPHVLPEFVSWHGNSNGQRYFFDEGKHTTNLASLSLSKLRGLPVPLPPHAEQMRIKAEVERLLSLASEAEAFSRTSLQRTARLRHSILKWAFEGRLVGGSTSP